jgi:hypothetical protein
VSENLLVFGTGGDAGGSILEFFLGLVTLFSSASSFFFFFAADGGTILVDVKEGKEKELEGEKRIFCGT